MNNLLRKVDFPRGEDRMVIVETMKKPSAQFKVENNLDKYVKELQSNFRINGKRRNLKQVQEVIGAYCNVTWYNIDSIRLGKSVPTLPVALKIAEYFGVKIEDIFEITK
jgi:DNA-binding XRE family transcriptional regulator